MSRYSPVVPIPDYQTLMRAILAFHADGDEHAAGEFRDAVVDEFAVTDPERAEMLPSGRAPLLNNRVGWTVTHLAQAGTLERTRRGYTRITDRGRELIVRHTDRIGAKDLESFPEYVAFLNRGTAVEAEGLAPEGSEEHAVWMVRAGRGGVYAPTFVEQSALVVGWGETGDVAGFSRDEIAEVVDSKFPEFNKNKRGIAVNILSRFAHTITKGDLVVTPEPATRTILFGWVAGPYEFLDDPIAARYQHCRRVDWFARVSRDELSYGARNSLGSLMTLTQPGHAGELLTLAEAHRHDEKPEALSQQAANAAASVTVVQRVPIPRSAAVIPQPLLADFQTVPRRLMQLLDELDNGQLALPDFQRSFVWSPDATRELIVSMIRSFPAGALLFLQGGSTTFKARAAEGAPALAVQASHLVLDGQQRLTSLYQAVFGTGQSRFFLASAL